MSGTPENPGVIVLMMFDLFDEIKKRQERAGGQMNFFVRASYLEIYNEDIRDLLIEVSTLMYFFD